MITLETLTTEHVEVLRMNARMIGDTATNEAARVVLAGGQGTTARLRLVKIWNARAAELAALLEQHREAARVRKEQAAYVAALLKRSRGRR